MRKKLGAAKSEIQAKKWTSAYHRVWGNELYNRAVNIQNPFFEKLFSPVMDELMKRDRKRQSACCYGAESTNKCNEIHDEQALLGFHEYHIVNTNKLLC